MEDGYICRLCEEREGGSETFESYKELDTHRRQEHGELFTESMKQMWGDG